MKKFRKFKDYHIEKLKSPKEVKLYLKIAMDEYEQDGDLQGLLLALRDVAEAQGGLATLAERTNLNRQNLYRALSPNGNPKLDTFEMIIHALGFRLALQPLDKAA